MYLIRLDDASDYMDVKKWNKIEKILDKYQIKPIVGIIPKNKDDSLISKYEHNDSFWKKALKWQEKGWTIAMHGYEHVYNTEEGGINPVQKRSEFAGLSLKEQREKIKNGFDILKKRGLLPKVFFAPSHTFDYDTLKALKLETNIRIISDTIARDVYYYNDFYFIPQQSGKVRKLPLKTVTFCYHPNTMIDDEFVELEEFLDKNLKEFITFSNIKLSKRKKTIFDKLLSSLYFLKRRMSK